jgi:hypothetical protein
VASAYKAQPIGAISTDINKVVWKFWVPQKNNIFFAWLALKNRLSTMDRLEKQGWPNYVLCPFSKEPCESVKHLLTDCRYTIRLWSLLKDWLGLYFMDF